MKRSLFSSKRCRNNKGFTLLEMVITLAIFILLSAAVFGVISGVLRSATTLQDNQNRRDQIAGLNAFLNKQLRNLTAESVLISYQRGDGEGLKQNGIIFGQDAMLTAVDATLQANGYYTVRLATLDPSLLPKYPALPVFVFRDAICKDDSGVVWIPVIHDVKQYEWRFQLYRIPQWIQLWTDTATKPTLVEFTLEQAGDIQPSVMDFWIPKIGITTVPSVSGSTSTSQPSPTPTPPNHAP